MSKTSRSCIRQKTTLYQQLEKFSRQQIDEFFNPNPADQQIDAFVTESEYYEKQYWDDVRDGLFEDNWTDLISDTFWDFDQYEPLSIYDERDDDYDEVYGPAFTVIDETCPYFKVGTYYKDDHDKTYLCVQIGNIRHLVDVLTGMELRQFNHKLLTKVG